MTARKKKIIIAVFAATALAAAVLLYFAWRGTGFYSIPPERLKSYTVERYEVPPDAEWYTIDNAAFSISSSGADARATTDGINEALLWAKDNGYSYVRFQPGTYTIQCLWDNRFSAPDDGILIPSGLTLDLGASTFILERSASPCYCIFAVVDKSDIRILGGTLIGDRQNHIYSFSADSPTHEYGFGISVCASRDITIQDVVIRDTTGDGIIIQGSYIAISDGGLNSSGVRVYSCDISGCRRQGISVVGAQNSEIAQNTIYNISGTAPEYGIDVEPEFDHPVSGLKVYLNNIYGCAGGSISCHNGSGYFVFANTCRQGNISAVKCSKVEIYDNLIYSGLIRIYLQAADTHVYNNQYDVFSRLIQGR